MENLYQFCFSDRRGDHVAGIVKAANIEAARKALMATFTREDLTRCRIEPVEFNRSGVCEVYYG